MFSSEPLNDINEDPTSELGDDNYLEDEDIEISQEGGIDNENDQIEAIDSSNRNQIARSATTKSRLSSAQSDGKQERSRHPPEVLYNLNTVVRRRDPEIENIIESRKFAVVENAYTRLSQITSQAPRLSQRSNPFEAPLVTDSETDLKERIETSQRNKKLAAVSAASLDKPEWDDGLAGENDKDTSSINDKPCLQVYEETCARLNICPCSIVTRCINATEMNLRNYGLGPRGSKALTAALIRNTTVSKINLAGNNIGSEGMSYLYHILIENMYIEEYDLSFNNLGTKGIRKLADGVHQCNQLKMLSIAGNDLNTNDLKTFLLKLEDHPSLKILDMSHNRLDEIVDEESGKPFRKWLADNNTLIELDISWCSIRMMGAKAFIDGIRDNNKLKSINLSYNCFANDTIEPLIRALSSNGMLCELNIHGNQYLCRYDVALKENPSLLITGKDSQIYKLISAAATNQSLKVFRIGQNHIDSRCLMIMLEALSQLTNITLEELDLTGVTVNAKQITKINSLFSNHPNFKCSLGPIHINIEQFAHNLLNLIHRHCVDNATDLHEIFFSNNEGLSPASIITYQQFMDGLRRAKIPFPITYIDDIMKYLGRENEPGQISIRSLDIS